MIGSRASPIRAATRPSPRLPYSSVMEQPEFLSQIVRVSLRLAFITSRPQMQTAPHVAKKEFSHSIR